MRIGGVDLRIWGPAAVAAACLLPRAVPAPAAPAAEPPRSVALPAVHGMARPDRHVCYELDAARSSARFLVEGPRGELWTCCPRIAGELELGPGPDEGTLSLRLDLASLRPLAGAASDFDVRHVAGVLGDVEVVYRGRLAATTTNDLPGVAGDLWDGTIHFGSRVMRQPVMLWRCSLPGRPLRTSGYGTVDAAAFGLPTRSWFQLVDEHHRVTLGLDLAWRRQHAH